MARTDDDAEIIVEAKGRSMTRWIAALLALLAGAADARADAFGTTAPPCTTSCTFATTALTGTTTAANITQSSTGIWVFQLHDSTSGFVFKNSAGALMINFDGSASTLKHLMPSQFNLSSSAVSGTWSLSANPVTIESATWTGTVTAANNFVTNSWIHTYNEDSGASPNTVLGIQANHGALATGNTYTIDSTTNMSAALTSGTTVELHAGRFTATANFNMGGTGVGGLAKGTLVGTKCAAGGTGTFLSESFACEVATSHTAGSVESSYGVGILDQSTIQGNADYAAVAVAGSNVGWKNGIAFGTFARGGPCGSAANCTLIGGQGLSGATYNIVRGIDFRKMVASSNYYDDGHVTIGSTGIVTTSKLNLTGVTTTCSAQPTGTVAVVSGVFTLCP